jgi:hypothetical protein
MPTGNYRTVVQSPGRSGFHWRLRPLTVTRAVGTGPTAGRMRCEDITRLHQLSGAPTLHCGPPNTRTLICHATTLAI